MNSEAACPIRNGPKSTHAKRSRIGNEPKAPDVFPLKKSISMRVLTVQSQTLERRFGVESEPGVPRGEHRILSAPLWDGNGRRHKVIGAFHGMEIVDSVEANETVPLVFRILEVAREQPREILDPGKSVEEVLVVRGGHRRGLG